MMAFSTLFNDRPSRFDQLLSALGLAVHQVWICVVKRFVATQHAPNRFQ